MTVRELNLDDGTPAGVYQCGTCGSTSCDLADMEHCCVPVIDRDGITVSSRATTCTPKERA